MERRKIIEIYCSDEGDKVSLDVEKVEKSKEANAIMNMLMKVLDDSGIGKIYDAVFEEEEEDEDIIEDKGDRE